MTNFVAKEKLKLKMTEGNVDFDFSLT